MGTAQLAALAFNGEQAADGALSLLQGLVQAIYIVGNDERMLAFEQRCKLGESGSFLSQQSLETLAARNRIHA
jgi:hypothetical protein